MLILFDIDGTLLDDPAAMRAGAAALHATAGLDGPFESFLADWCAAADRQFDRYIRGEVDYQEQRRARVREVVDGSVDDAGADALFAAYLEAHEHAWSLYDDSLPCLDALSGHRLGVVSNGLGQQQRDKLARTGIIDRFERVVISAEVGERKPDAAIFLHACANAGCVPSEVVYIGDRYETDALGARRAGLTGVWLDRDGARSAAHDGPIVTGLAEFVGLVNTIHPA
jgi:putative hydrolase of the HAD superfamily